MITKTNFFTSAWDFTKEESDLKNKFQMINVAIVLSTIGLITGIISNTIGGIPALIPFEMLLLGINFLLFLLLRYKKESLKLVSLIETAQFTLLFLVLMYISEPNDLKHIWIFTYPILLLYFQNGNNSFYWVVFMVIMLILTPLQPFINVSYTLFQVLYMSVVLMIISIIVYFYQNKIDKAKNVIKMQVHELTKKDRLLSLQSKQAVMGEMISMIAHQWRQPLSTVTLSISDIQLKKMLGKEVDDKFMDKALQDISDTVVYLSDTIDDFQTYFAPNKTLSEERICEIINRAVNFTKARMNSARISFKFKECNDGLIQTYSNELVQVILNILNNAIDELLENKKDKASISIRVLEKSNSFDIFIKDNGRGISPENLESIFEPYYSTKGKNGTGLGLYMSQMIMEKQFNSQIEVISSKEGTEFCIKVPKKLA
ncbi:HAMP domain-containing histidine kinase [Sulfurimonas sp. SAG-AH-194-L11]|nr:HAMP domain-containing sensor histidine kinase [Sulfurimonas sp. SAG-AH-194-L11]MDF1876484.1 HAMP domain-containing histidine kinase [Sulfurimonas sp. SAG-AH-194-L11]